MSILTNGQTTNRITNRPTLLGPDGNPIPLSLAPDEGFALPHVVTFTSLFNMISRTYSWRWDEAYKTCRDDALSMRRDCFLMGLMQERKLATAQLPWHLEAESENDRDQNEAADWITKIITSTPHLQNLLMVLMEKVWYGRYGAQGKIGWVDVDGKRAMRWTDFRPVNGDKIQFRYKLFDDGPDVEDGTPAVLVHSMHGELPGATTVLTDRGKALLLNNDYWRQRFIIAKHYDLDDADFFEGEMAGGVHGIGVRSRIYWMNWIRMEWLSNISDWIQRAGLGALIFYYEESNPASKIKAIEAANEQSQNAVIVWPRPIGTEKQGAGIESISPPMSGSDALLKMAGHLEEMIERYIVGQSMSSGRDNESGLGGTGRSNFAAETKYRIVKADSQSLADTLTEDFVDPLLRWNIPGARFRLRWVFDVDKPNGKDQLEAAKTIQSMGADLDADEVRGYAGFSKPHEGAEILPGVKPGQAPGAPGGAPPSGALGGGSSELLGRVKEQNGIEDYEEATPEAAVKAARAYLRRYGAEFKESDHPRADDGKFSETSENHIDTAYDWIHGESGIKAYKDVSENLNVLFGDVEEGNGLSADQVRDTVQEIMQDHHARLNKVKDALKSAGASDKDVARLERLAERANAAISKKLDAYVKVAPHVLEAMNELQALHDSAAEMPKFDEWLAKEDPDGKSHEDVDLMEKLEAAYDRKQAEFEREDYQHAGKIERAEAKVERAKQRVTDAASALESMIDELFDSRLGEIAEGILDELPEEEAERNRRKYGAASPTRYAQWITLGGHPEGDEKHVGGFQVQIDESGNILNGPAGLKGKNVSEVKSHFDSTKGKQPATPAATKQPAQPKPASQPEQPKQPAAAAGPSKAKVTIPTNAAISPEKVAVAAKNLLGTDATQALASVVGAPDDSTVTVTINRSGSLFLKTEHPSFTAHRSMHKDANGKTYLSNEEITIKGTDQGKGIGTAVFSRQVEQAQKAGVSYIKAHAAALDDDGKRAYNGYYTWARLGYDQALDDKAANPQARQVFAQAKQKFPQAKSVLDIMSTPEGRDWWKKNGTDMENAVFDLTPGSRSMKVLEAYRAERAKNKAP